MPATHAALYRIERTEDRVPVARPSTLRGPNGDPGDVLIEDLSTTGCRLATATDHAIGDEVMIGLAGVGIRQAQVVWAEEGHIGCAFDEPLSLNDIQKTRFAETVAEGRFGNLPTAAEEDAEDGAQGSDFSPRMRLAIIGSLAVASWLAIGGVAAAGLALVQG